MIDLTRDTVAKNIREYLSLVPAGTISTREMVQVIYPQEDTADIKIRRQLYVIVLDLAAHELSDCATRSKVPLARKAFGKDTVAYPWLWHKPDGSRPGAKPVTTPTGQVAMQNDLLALAARVTALEGKL